MAFPSFPAVTAVGSRLAGAYRVIRVDPTNGQTAIGSGSGSQTGDGWSIPINTIQGAIEYIKANRANGKNGTANEWWGIEVSPGTYAENIKIYAWMHVYCMTPRAARIVGAVSNADPLVTLEGGTESGDEIESPCTISGYDLWVYDLARRR